MSFIPDRFSYSKIVVIVCGTGRSVIFCRVYTHSVLIRNGPIGHICEIFGFFMTSEILKVKKRLGYPPDLEETPLVNFFNLRNSKRSFPVLERPFPVLDRPFLF